MLELITDRTQADVKRAKELNEKVYAAFASMPTVLAADTDVLIEPAEIIQSTLTEEEFAEWKSGLKGAYNYTDFNRVESAVKDVANLWVYGLTTKTDWKMSDELTQTEMQRFLANLQAIKAKLGSDIPIPANMSQFTYQSANNIEKMLRDAYEYRNTHTVGQLSVGDSLWLNVSGEKKEFIVVHQGNPDSSVYGSSCNGTWLLMKEIYTERPWNAYNSVEYGRSSLAEYLTGNFKQLLDAYLPIKLASIPVRVLGSDTSSIVSYTGQVFLLSAWELGLSPTDDAEEGTALDYFKDGKAENLIAYYHGVASVWWTRSIKSREQNGASVSGTAYVIAGHNPVVIWGSYVRNIHGVRPALILDSNTVFATLDGKNIID